MAVLATGPAGAPEGMRFRLAKMALKIACLGNLNCPQEHTDSTSRARPRPQQNRVASPLGFGCPPRGVSESKTKDDRARMRLKHGQVVWIYTLGPCFEVGTAWDQGNPPASNFPKNADCTNGAVSSWTGITLQATQLCFATY